MIWSTTSSAASPSSATTRALLGSEFRPFDPYQSNYLLEAIGSYRFGQTEVLGVLNHVSRHLGDRFKPLAVAENSLGPRVMRRFTFDDKTLEVRGNVRKVIARAYVDYTWMADIDLIAEGRRPPETRRVRTRIRPAHHRGQDNRRTRSTSPAAESKPAFCCSGVKGDMELFVGGERVIDADQLDRVPRRWAFVGFRLLRN